MLTVRAALVRGQAHGFGRLVIDGQRIAVVPGRASRLVLPPGVEHSGDTLTVYDPIIGRPPLFQSLSLVIEPSDDHPWLAVLPQWRRKAVLSAVEDLGLWVELRKRPLDLGFTRVYRSRGGGGPG